MWKKNTWWSFGVTTLKYQKLVNYTEIFKKVLCHGITFIASNYLISSQPHIHIRRTSPSLLPNELISTTKSIQNRSNFRYCVQNISHTAKREQDNIDKSNHR